MKHFLVIAEAPELEFEEFSFYAQPEDAVEVAETLAWLNDRVDILMVEEATA